MGDTNFVQEKLDLIFRDHKYSPFLIAENEVHLTYFDLYNKLQFIKNKFQSLNINCEQKL